VQEVHNTELGFCRLRSGEEHGWNPAKCVIGLSHGNRGEETLWPEPFLHQRHGTNQCLTMQRQTRGSSWQLDHYIAMW
jgi:hypothetical protein